MSVSRPPLSPSLPTAANPPRRSPVLAGDRPAETVAFEADIVEFFVDAAELLGLPRSMAAIYGIVFASPAPLSFADVCHRLDLSKGSVSQGLRILREVGAVQEVSAKEDPAELFIPNLEMRQLIGRYLAGRLDPQLKNGRDRLGTLETRLAVLSTDDRKLLGPRVQKLQRWHARSRALMPLVKTFLRI